MKQHLSCLHVVESPAEISEEKDVWETITAVEEDEEDVESYSSDLNEEVEAIEERKTYQKKRILSN